MAESMQGLKRSHRCTEVGAAHIGQEVTVMGWVQKQRRDYIRGFAGPVRDPADYF